MSKEDLQDAFRKHQNSVLLLLCFFRGGGWRGGEGVVGRKGFMRPSSNQQFRITQAPSIQVS